MKCFMGNPCGFGYCKRSDCEKCGMYKPTVYGIRVPRFVGNLGFKLEVWLWRMYFRMKHR